MTDPASGRIVVVGDVIDDIVVVPRGPIRTDTDTPALVRPRPGGAAANTAAWLGCQEAPVTLVAAVGAADVARHESELRAAGVEPALRGVPDASTGTIVVLVDGETRTMLTDRGANSALRDTDVTDELLADAAVLHVSGYAVLDGLGADGMRSLIARATAAGVPVSTGPASVGHVADVGVETFSAAIDGVTILLANRAEACQLAGVDDPLAAARALAIRYPVVVVTTGSAGALVAVDGAEPIAVPAERVSVADPTGAGDAFTAGFLDTWLTTGDAVVSAAAGSRLAARAVSAIGGRPQR